MKGLRLYKIEKLCSPVAIENLFSRSGQTGNLSAISYPWRAVWRADIQPGVGCARFLISVPKKRLRHAVDRVKMRRRCREAYRLSRDILPAGTTVNIAFVYIADSLTPYQRSTASVRRLLHKIAASLSAPAPANEEAQ